MLQVIDERLSIWGWETGTGTKFAIVVDMWGMDGRPGTGFGLKGEDVRPVRWFPLSRSFEEQTDELTRRPSRRSKHCRRHIYDYCKIHSTHLTITPQWQRRVEGVKEGK